MKVLITGILGQDGSYLSQLLLQKGYNVYGMVRSNSDYSNHEYLRIRDKIEYLECDLQDEVGITKFIQEIQPDELYHLGGLSAPGQSWDKPKEFTMVNALGSLYLLEAIRLHSPNTRVFNAATSEMFGTSHNNGLQTEETPFAPTNPYAVTKIYSYWMSNIYKRSYNLFLANGILFSHESPLRSPQFVTGKIAHGVAQIKLGLADSITLGNIDSERDWGYAGDYVEAMWMMLQQDQPDDFVISSGEVHSIREFLHYAFEAIEISDWEEYIKIDPKLYRPIDLKSLYGSNEKVKTKLHWEPKVDFRELVSMMVQSYIKRLS